MRRPVADGTLRGENQQMAGDWHGQRAVVAFSDSVGFAAIQEALLGLLVVRAFGN